MTPSKKTAQTITDLAQFSWLDLGRALWYFVGRRKTTYNTLLVLLSLIFIYDFFPPWAVGKIVDTLNQGADQARLVLAYQLALFVGSSFIAVAHIRQVIKNRLGKIAVDTQYQTRVDGFARLMDYSLAWHQSEYTGSKMQRITSGVYHLRGLMSLLSREILSHSVIILGSIIIFATFGGWFALLGVSFGLLFLANEWYFYHKNLAANDAYNRSLEKSQGTYFESASNVLTIKSLGVKDAAQSQLNKAEARARQHGHTMRDLTTAKWRSFQTINGLALMVLLMLVIGRVGAGTMTTGTVLVFFSYLIRMTKSAGDTGEILVEAIEHKSAIGRMMPIYWNELVVRSGTKKFPATWQTIAIRDGAFRYRGADDAFKISHLNLEIKRTEKVGVVGTSGSGKSTLAKLLLGLYDLEAGSFMIGSANYYDLRHSEVTAHISTVLQETELFNATLRENLTLFRSVPDAVLARAVKIAQLAPVLAQLPDGLEGLIGEKGYKLSGGERQRVGIARALCGTPEMLILDEATAALDSKTEAAFLTNLEKQLKETTMLVIAHRLSTLKTMDRIIVFEHGQVIEEGTFRQLLANPKSRFSELYRLQTKQPGQT